MKQKHQLLARYRVKLVKDGHMRVSDHLPVKTEGENDAAFWAREILRDSPVEKMLVLYIGAQNDVVGYEVVAQGGIHSSAATPADVLRGAILMCSSAIVIAHNHPSGVVTPSKADIVFTIILKDMASALGLMLVDHIIVTNKNEAMFSFCRDTQLMGT